MARSIVIMSRNAKLLLPALAATAMAAGLTAGKAEAAASGAFLPHQALYELSLLKSPRLQFDQQRAGAYPL